MVAPAPLNPPDNLMPGGVPGPGDGPRWPQPRSTRPTIKCQARYQGQVMAHGGPSPAQPARQ